MSEVFIGIDLGGTKIKGCLVNSSGELLRQIETETNDAGDAAWVEGVKRLILSLEGKRPSVKGIGVAAPGIVAMCGRSIGTMPGRMQGLEGLDWTEELGRDFEVPILNDAHAYALGEAWLGAARGCRNAVVITLGTGVGGGVISDGKLLLGHRRRAGHLGHLSLDPEGPLDATHTPGSLENAIGELTLSQRSGGRFATTVDLLAAVRRGDKEASSIWLASVRALAAAIVSFINLFDPEKVVLGGGIARAGSDLLTPLLSRLDEIEWRLYDQQVSIRLANLGSWAGAIGAARHAMGGSE